MDDVGKGWVLICWVIRSSNLADRLNMPLSMLDNGLPADGQLAITTATAL